MGRRDQDAGTHSGDATLLLPSQRLYLETHRRVMHVAAQLPRAQTGGDMEMLKKYDESAFVSKWLNMRQDGLLKEISV